MIGKDQKSTKENGKKKEGERLSERRGECEKPGCSVSAPGSCCLLFQLCWSAGQQPLLSRHRNPVSMVAQQFGCIHNWQLRVSQFLLPPHLCCALQRSHFSLLGVTGKKKKKMLTGVTVSFQSQLRPHRSVPPTQIPMCYSLHRLWLESSKRTTETKLISRHLSVMIPRPFGNMTAKLSHQQQRQNKAGMKTKNLISL